MSRRIPASDERGTARPRARRGFTLVEVIVVLAVLAVLVGLSAAAISRARQASAVAGCRSNLRSIGQAFLSYVGTNNAFYPFVKESSPQWEDLLCVHGLNREVHFRCAADQEIFPSLGSSYDWRDAGGPDTDPLTGAPLHPTSLSGRKYPVRPDLVMAFEALTGWHRPRLVNVVLTDGVVDEMDQDRFFANLNCAVTP